MFRESAGLRPYSRQIYLGTLADGSHTITVKAYDDVGNVKEVSDHIYLSRGINTPAVLPIEAKPQITFNSPKTGDTLLAKNFPVGIELQVVNSMLVQLINVYYNDSYGNPLVISQASGAPQERIKFFWNTAPAPGDYTVYVIVVDKEGGSYREETQITIQ
jgi:hypothetical protein